MKTTIHLAILIGLAGSGLALAEPNMKNVQQQEDIVHGYQKSEPSPYRPADAGDRRMSNVQQQEDIVHGYGKTAASTAEPATVRIGNANRQQQEDIVHGYAK